VGPMHLALKSTIAQAMGGEGRAERSCPTGGGKREQQQDMGWLHSSAHAVSHGRFTGAPLLPTQCKRASLPVPLGAH
jgi:hypothetical protein